MLNFLKTDNISHKKYCSPQLVLEKQYSKILILQPGTVVAGLSPTKSNNILKHALKYPKLARKSGQGNFTLI